MRPRPPVVPALSSAVRRRIIAAPASPAIPSLPALMSLPDSSLGGPLMVGVSPSLAASPGSRSDGHCPTPDLTSILDSPLSAVYSE